jgi:hypothetical protein
MGQAPCALKRGVKEHEADSEELFIPGLQSSSLQSYIEAIVPLPVHCLCVQVMPTNALCNHSLSSTVGFKCL